MSHLLHFAVMLACCLAAVRPLARARWVTRMPRTALLTWQILGLTLELSLLGLVFAAVFAPANQGLVPGLLHVASVDGVPTGPLAPAALALGAAYLAARCWTLGRVCRDLARHRRRHRHLLTLVARSREALPGVEVLDHPVPAAYCLPGRPGLVVLSTGALCLLGPRHLAAVVAHERAHLRQRHDLVLLPLLAWRRLLPRSPLLREAVAAVRLLLEMCADDACCRRLPRRDLTDALARFTAAGGTVPPPAGGFAAADTAVTARTARLLAPPPKTTAFARTAVLAVAATALSTPVSLFALPL
ncbi:M56 family metallopeptidase [Streptomyces sp. B8F3]|uniref:M56 family metallopeptidase n=1 Tax=unclassified Streptomyces TaxID=2593676 RepID=UPI00325F1B1C